MMNPQKPQDQIANAVRTTTEVVWQTMERALGASTRASVLAAREIGDENASQFLRLMAERDQLREEVERLRSALADKTATPSEPAGGVHHNGG